MGMYAIKCMPGFSTNYASALTQTLEAHTSAMDASYRDSYLQWLTALATLHDAVDAALDRDLAFAARYVATAQGQLASTNDGLTGIGQALVELRADLFERGKADASEPLIAREPFFATLDYDGVYRELEAARCVLPQRAFWDETASRLRDQGARGGFRLLDRHLRELQSDLHAFIADVDAASRLPPREMAEALHSISVPVARVMTGYTRLLTTFGYVSLLCERATSVWEQATRVRETVPALAAS